MKEIPQFCEFVNGKLKHNELKRTLIKYVEDGFDML